MSSHRKSELQAHTETITRGWYTDISLQGGQAGRGGRISRRDYTGERQSAIENGGAGSRGSRPQCKAPVPISSLQPFC
jgi:hypothetical protein